jgi:hypothetical protein
VDVFLVIDNTPHDLIEGSVFLVTTTRFGKPAQVEEQLLFMDLSSLANYELDSETLTRIRVIRVIHPGKNFCAIFCG